MTAFALPAWFASFTAPAAPAAARTDPPVRRAAPPLLISDVATPFAGETLLLAMLRADVDRQIDEAAAPQASQPGRVRRD